MTIMESSPDTPAREENAPVCIVTGLSGAGKSVALRVFEDLGYFTVDGLPASLAPEMVGMMRRPSMEHFRGIALTGTGKKKKSEKTAGECNFIKIRQGTAAQVRFRHKKNETPAKADIQE